MTDRQTTDDRQTRHCTKGSTDSTVGQKPCVHTSQNFLYILILATTWSFSEDNVINYAFPVFWMMSFFHLLWRCRQNNVVATGAKSDIFLCLVSVYHWLRDSFGTVLMVTGFINGNHWFSTPAAPQIWPPLTDYQKIVTCDYVGDSYHKTKFGANPPTWGFWANVKYNQIYIDLFIYTLFLWELTYRSDQSADFRAWWLKRRGFIQGCAFLRFCWYWCPFKMSYSPKP